MDKADYSNIHLALVHFPVYNKVGEIVVSSVTTLDVHDISRVCRTYGAGSFYVVTPLKTQKELVERMVSHWMKGFGAEYNPTRKDALQQTKVIKSLDEVINRIMLYKKGRQAFITLSILYPNLRYNEIEFDQDHIHPSFSFSDIKLKDINLNSSDMIRWQEMKDQLPNLQMMEGRKNRQKNKTPFNDWLNEMFNDENNIKTSKEVYLNDNYIPKGISYNIKNFEIFFDKRRSILIKRLKEILDN